MIFSNVAEKWELEELGNGQYDEGYSPSLAQAPLGQVAMAYYRCVQSQGELGECTPNDDGLVFGWKDARWSYELVDGGEEEGVCGMSPSLVFDGEGHALVAYRCEIWQGEKLESEIRFAKRALLP